MKIIALTTKEYYSFAESNFWEKIDCEQMKDFLSSLYETSNEDEDKDKIIESFFSKAAAKSENADIFWIKNSGKDFRILKRHLNDCTIYILPCIPEYHFISKDRLCYDLKVRQDYIGTYINMIYDDNKYQEILSDDIMLILHDLDIFAKSKSEGDERIVKSDEIIRDSLLGELVKEKKIKIKNIYGFQHDYDPEEWRIYPLIVEKGRLLEQNPIDDFAEKLHNRIKLNKELNSF